MYKNIDEIKQAHTGYFFDPETAYFFSSKIYGHTWPVEAGAYFITSEVDPTHMRKYTIRFCDLEGAISTVGDFMEYYTLLDALRGLYEVLDED